MMNKVICSAECLNIDCSNHRLNSETSKIIHQHILEVDAANFAVCDGRTPKPKTIFLTSQDLSKGCENKL